ncbi:MAG: hypothetical protein IPJ88_17410 [Myxococcales bacterium]|nr:MAG: hypothetical protein IPJ88_17410 [Myxococcales bacterium]
MSAEKFGAAIQEAILSLPQDCKAVLRIVEDPDLDDTQRTDAAGALLHVLSGSNVIPGMKGILAYVDDVLVMRVVLERLSKASPEAFSAHHEEFPEVYQPMTEQLQVAREHLGDLMKVIEHAAARVSTLNFKGHTAIDCSKDTEGSTWLYDSLQEALVDQFDFDDEEVARELKELRKIMPALEQRAANLKA